MEVFLCVVKAGEIYICLVKAHKIVMNRDE